MLSLGRDLYQSLVDSIRVSANSLHLMSNSAC